MPTNAVTATIEDVPSFGTSDIFSAESAGVGLTNIITSAKPNVTVLDGPWGSGKTTFVRQWVDALRASHYRVVYWDAFRSDHHEDALFPMLVNLTRDFQSAKADSKHVRRLHTAAKHMVAAIPDTMMTLALSLEDLHWTGKILLKMGRVLRKDVKPERNQSLFDKRLQRATAEAEAFEEFQETLDRLVPSPPRPLIFVIDELDRCHPPFALNVLERMKHVFANRRICFVLVTHLAELAAMVKHAYGLADPRRYLEKFYQLRVEIDNILYSGDESVRATYVAHLIATEQLDDDVADRHVTQTLMNLAELHNIQLRMLEHILLNYKLYIDAGKWASFREINHIAAALCVMRAAAPDMYRSASTEGVTFGDVGAFLKLDDWSILKQQRDLNTIEAWWRLVTSEEGTGDVAERMRALRSQYGHAIIPDTRVDAGPINRLLENISKNIDLFWQQRRGS